MSEQNVPAEEGSWGPYGYIPPVQNLSPSLDFGGAVGGVRPDARAPKDLPAEVMEQPEIRPAPFM